MRPEIRRTLSEVEPGLRSLFDALAAGGRPWPLYLCGPPGTGKTCAALSLLDHAGRVPLHRRGDLGEWAAGFVEVRSLPRIRIAADQRRLSVEEGGSLYVVAWSDLLRSAGEAPLFVLDDIGIGSEASDFRLDGLIEILDRRAGGRPLVITSNLDPSAVARVYDDRVASRALSGSVYRLGGQDRRFLPRGHNG